MRRRRRLRSNPAWSEAFSAIKGVDGPRVGVTWWTDREAIYLSYDRQSRLCSLDWGPTKLTRIHVEGVGMDVPVYTGSGDGATWESDARLAHPDDELKRYIGMRIYSLYMGMRESLRGELGKLFSRINRKNEKEFFYISRTSFDPY